MDFVTCAWTSDAAELMKIGVKKTLRINVIFFLYCHKVVHLCVFDLHKEGREGIASQGDASIIYSSAIHFGVDPQFAYSYRLIPHPASQPSTRQVAARLSLFSCSLRRSDARMSFCGLSCSDMTDCF